MYDSAGICTNNWSPIILRYPVVGIGVPKYENHRL